MLCDGRPVTFLPPARQVVQLMKCSWQYPASSIRSTPRLANVSDASAPLEGRYHEPIVRVETLQRTGRGTFKVIQLLGAKLRSETSDPISQHHVQVSWVALPHLKYTLN